MKALTTILVSLIVLVVQAGPASIAAGQEGPVDEQSLNASNTVAVIIPLEEEEYCDDIPFNTAGIAFAHKRCCIRLPEEAYVDDIPFNTTVIAARERIPMEEEEPVNDLLPDCHSVETHLVSAQGSLLRAQMLLGELQGRLFELNSITLHAAPALPVDCGMLIMELDRDLDTGINGIREVLGM